MSTYDLEGPEAAQDDAKYMQYPDTVGFEVKNWISFEAYDFKEKNLTLDIALYIPGDGLSTTYKSDYESVSLGMMGAAGASAVNFITDAAAAKNAEKSGGELSKMLNSVTSSIKSEGTAVGQLKAGEFASGLKGAAGAKTIMEREVGMVLNPYIVAAYKGPSDLRAHEFTFQMLPQSINESRNCMRIANAFKKAMLPYHRGGESAAATSMLFGYPDEFEISYTINGNPLPKTDSNPMFNIGRSVLTQCDLDFATENVPLFFDGTQYPVSISMKLSFMEIQVMHRGKISQGY